jgi:hypothetical protein
MRTQQFAREPSVPDGIAMTWSCRAAVTVPRTEYVEEPDPTEFANERG